MALYPNGRAPASALVTIYGNVASPDMARRVRYVKEEYDRTHQDNLVINEIYRTFEQQVIQKERWTNLGQPGNAATPGYSNHGAWDIGAVDWSCTDIAARREIAARVGLIHNISNESWHAAAIGTISVPLPELAGANYIETQEDDMFNDTDRAEIRVLLQSQKEIQLNTWQANQWLKGDGPSSIMGKLDLCLYLLQGNKPTDGSIKTLLAEVEQDVQKLLDAQSK